MVVNGHEHVRSGWERGHVGPPRIQLLAVRCGKDPTHDDMGDSGYCAPSPLGPFFFFFWTQRRKPSREVWARSLSTSCDSRSTKMRVPCDSGCVTQVAGCTAQQRGYSPLARSSYFFFSSLAFLSNHGGGTNQMDMSRLEGTALNSFHNSLKTRGGHMRVAASSIWAGDPALLGSRCEAPTCVLCQVSLSQLTPAHIGRCACTDPPSPRSLLLCRLDTWPLAWEERDSGDRDVETARVS